MSPRRWVISFRLWRLSRRIRRLERTRDALFQGMAIVNLELLRTMLQRMQLEAESGAGQAMKPGAQTSRATLLSALPTRSGTSLH